MPKDRYIGLKSAVTANYRQGGSKFIGFIYPVRDREEAQEYLSALREEFTDATHVCHATLLGIDRDFQHCSDDGEPSNSAGRPILNALLSSDLNFVFAAVVRYYGGKKLGVPGLIEAYGNTIRECLILSELEEITLTDRLICTIDPSYSYLIFNLLNRYKEINIETVEEHYHIEIPKSMTSSLREQMQNLPTLAFLE